MDSFSSYFQQTNFNPWKFRKTEALRESWPGVEHFLCIVINIVVFTPQTWLWRGWYRFVMNFTPISNFLLLISTPYLMTFFGLITFNVRVQWSMRSCHVILTASWTEFTTSWFTRKVWSCIHVKSTLYCEPHETHNNSGGRKFLNFMQNMSGC